MSKDKKIKSENALVSIFRHNWGILAALAVLFIFFSVTSPTFLKANNLSNILQQISMLCVCAVGMTYVILAGGIDLSIGATLGMTGGVMAYLMTAAELPFGLAILVGVIMGIAAGIINGLLITCFDLPPFIVTLASRQVVRGIIFILTGGQSIYNFPKGFRVLGKSVFEIPIPIIIMVLVIIVSCFILYKTKCGRYIYAIGGNMQASYLSGINTKMMTIFVYAFAGLTASIAAIIMDARLNAAAPTAGENYELNAIAAVVIGGTSMAGGEGKISGTIIGVLIIGVINNGMNLLNVSQGMQKVVLGCVMVIAVIMDMLRRRSEKK